MKEATLFVYRDDNNEARLWRGEVIDNRNGSSICCTTGVPSRSQAMLDGATHALDQGYSVALASGEHRTDR